jgi:hypothetical protein
VPYFTTSRNITYDGFTAKVEDLDEKEKVNDKRN